MTLRQALDFIRYHGVVLEGAKGLEPSIAVKVAGEEISGRSLASERSSLALLVAQVSRCIGLRMNWKEGKEIVLTQGLEQRPLALFEGHRNRGVRKIALEGSLPSRLWLAADAPNLSTPRHLSLGFQDRRHGLYRPSRCRQVHQNHGDAGSS